MKYTENMSFVDIEKAIPMLAKRGAGFRADIQKVILSIGKAWLASGNVAHAAKLYGRVVSEVEGYYGQALVNYIEAYHSMTWSEKEKTFTYTQTKVDVNTLKAMKAEPFWQFSPPPEPKAKNYAALLYALLAANAKASAPDAIAKRKAKGLEDTLLPLDVVREVKTILAKEGITEA